MHKAGFRASDGPRAELTGLVYELLDAHDDTARMAATLSPDPEWDGHLDYLRHLQRVGRELLAAATGNVASGSP
jgi:hypothetical protein